MTEAAATDGVLSGPDDERCMRAALEAAQRGMLAGEPPVGACLVRGEEIIATQGNAVISELDITAHAEMQVIRAACRKLRQLELTGCRLYVTVEPCRMCLAACHYAGIDVIVYGASLADMDAVTGRELAGQPPAAESGAGQPALQGGCLAEECRALLETWAQGFARGVTD